MLALRGSLRLASDDVNMADGSEPDGFASCQKYSGDAYNLSLDLGMVQDLLRSVFSTLKTLEVQKGLDQGLG